MRILHLSTTTIGGAGVVASTIAKRSLLDGHEVLLLTLNNRGNKLARQKKRNILQRGISQANTVFSELDTKDKWGQLTSTSRSANLLDDVIVFSPEVIHIHNWFNLLNSTDIKRLIERFPCVFHVHDARLMTGGCHFTLDCTEYLNQCSSCPATNHKKYLVKKSYRKYDNVFTEFSSYGLIFPSRWLQKNFVGSPIYDHADVITSATNPIPLEVVDSLLTKKKESIVCVISQLNAPIKGFDQFLGAIEKLRDHGNEILVQVVGTNATKNQIEKATQLNVKLLGGLSNSETLQVIGDSELLVVPSLSENLPTVILEAQAVGTSVLVTAIKGCLELVEEEKTGFVCDPSADSIFYGINRALDSENRSDIVDFAKLESRRRISEFDSLMYSTYQNVIAHHSSKSRA